MRFTDVSQLKAFNKIHRELKKAQTAFELDKETLFALVDMAKKEIEKEEAK
jgi:hypothetical protein